MKIFTCSVIDDNQDAIDLIVSHIKQTPSLSLMGTESDAAMAKQRLISGELRSDIVFLDIQMPGNDGIELAGLINKECAIVFISGYREFGPEAFALNVADYRIKPVFYQEFLISVEKAKRKWAELNRFDFSGLKPYIYVPDKGKSKIRINTETILYIQAQGNYSLIYPGKDPILSYITLAKLEEELPVPHFIRIHKSFMVNVSKIIRYNNYSVFLPLGFELPVGPNYKAIVNKVLLRMDIRNENT